MNPRVRREWRQTCVCCLSVFIVAMTGCSYRHYPLIKEAVSHGKIPELSSATSYSYVFPEFAEGQRYSRVELMQNITIETAEGPQHCSFVLGNRRKDGRWEIVSAAIRIKDGTWRELEIDSQSDGNEVALAGR